MRSWSATGPLRRGDARRSRVRDRRRFQCVTHALRNDRAHPSPASVPKDHHAKSKPPTCNMVKTTLPRDKRHHWQRVAPPSASLQEASSRQQRRHKAECKMSNPSKPNAPRRSRPAGRRRTPTLSRVSTFRSRLRPQELRLERSVVETSNESAVTNEPTVLQAQRGNRPARDDVSPPLTRERQTEASRIDGLATEAKTIVKMT